MSAPVYFSDSLAARAAPLRYRQIGNPYAFLNGIGIEAVLEQIYRGNNIVDVARMLDIGIGVLLNWLNNEGHMQKVEEATVFSAEGHLSDAARLLREASTDFEFKKAKELASHGRFMATKLNRTKYGDTQKALPPSNQLQFVLHMGGMAPQKITGTVIENEAPPQHLEMDRREGVFSLFPTPQGVAAPDAIGPFEAPPMEPSRDNVPEHLRQPKWLESA